MYAYLENKTNNYLVVKHTYLNRDQVNTVASNWLKTSSKGHTIYATWDYISSKNCIPEYASSYPSKLPKQLEAGTVQLSEVRTPAFRYHQTKRISCMTKIWRVTVRWSSTKEARTLGKELQNTCHGKLNVSTKSAQFPEVRENKIPVFSFLSLLASLILSDLARD